MCFCMSPCSCQAVRWLAGGAEPAVCVTGARTAKTSLCSFWGSLCYSAASPVPWGYWLCRDLVHDCPPAMRAWVWPPSVCFWLLVAQASVPVPTAGCRPSCQCQDARLPFPQLLPARVNVQPPFGMGDRPDPTNDVLGMRRPFLQHQPSRVPTRRRRRRRKSCPRLTGVCFHPQILSPLADFKLALQGRKTGR